MQPRKIVYIVETLYAEAGKAGSKPITRAAVAAVIVNPYHGEHVDDLSHLFDQGGQLGEMLAADLVARLPYPPISYGKAALVGARGDFEHGGALIHPKLGKPLRAAVGSMTNHEERWPPQGPDAEYRTARVAGRRAFPFSRYLRWLDPNPMV